MQEILGSAATMLYGSSAYEDSVKGVTDVHAERIAQQERLHQLELEHSALQYMEASSQKRVLFTEATAHKLMLAENESKRDLWQQRNEATQTIMIINTVVFVCAYSLIVDGLVQWPEVVSEYPAIPITYAILGGLSIFLLLVCFSLCLMLYHRMGLYRTLGTYTFCTRRCRNKHTTFSGYYYYHCRPLERALLGFFYGAVCTTLAGLVVYQLPKHLYVFERTELAIIFGVTTAVGFFWPLMGAFVWPFDTWRAEDNPKLKMQ